MAAVSLCGHFYFWNRTITQWLSHNGIKTEPEIATDGRNTDVLPVFIAVNLNFKRQRGRQLLSNHKQRQYIWKPQEYITRYFYHLYTSISCLDGWRS